MSSLINYGGIKKRKFSKVGPKARGRSGVVARRIPLYKGIQDRPVHTITRSCEIRMISNTFGYSFTVGTGTATTFSIWFTNQDAFIWSNASSYTQVNIPGYTDLAALFDEVMIEKVDITIFTGNDPTNNGTGSAQIIFAKDYNDKVAPANAGDVHQYADCKAYNMTNAFINKITVYPKFLSYSMDATGNPVSSTPKRGYVRSNLQIEHYGLKGAFINLSPNQQYHTYQFKYYFKCRIVK